MSYYLVHFRLNIKTCVFLSDTLNRSDDDEVGQLSAIDEFENEVRANSFVVTDLQHIADRQSFNEIALRAEELLKGLDRKTQEQFRKFKALYDTYSKEFLGKSQFPKPESEEFTEKPLVTQFPTPMPVAPQLEVQNSRELVEPNDELRALRRKKTAMYWAIGVAIVLNVPLPVLGAIAAVAIYYFGVRSVKESLAPLEQEYEKEVERVRQSKQAELNDEHQQAVADWEKSKAEFEARIPTMNEEIEKHNASVRERCAEAQAKWEKKRVKAVSAINGYIARHPTIEVRFSPVGEVQQERDDDLRKTFGVKSAHQTDQRS